jgi:hypothetical protein
VWLVVRVTLGWLWFDAGRRQLHGTAGFSAPGPPLAAQAAAIVLTLAGIALMLGALVGIAAFGGGLLGSGLVPPETLPVGPLPFVAAVWLILAWKTAGWIGLDRWLLPWLGMPWRGGALLEGRLMVHEPLRTRLRRRSWTG